jgi:signal transduction histidine kinase
MEQLDQWKQYATSVHYHAGDVIFHEGDRAEEAFILGQGRVAIIKASGPTTSLVLGERTVGHLIGEMGLLQDAPRSASAIALEPTMLLAISKTDFWRLMYENRDFQQMVVATLIGNVLTADENRIAVAAAERDLFDRLSKLASENEQLAELMQLRQETIHFIVHDLRNPLHMMHMVIENLGLGADKIDEARRARFLALARGGVDRMLGMVDAMLDVERLDGGQAKLDMAPLDLPQLIETVVNRAKPLADASQLTLTILPFPPDLPPVTADRLRLDRVLTNLIDNAIKFVPPDGKITVGAARAKSGVSVSINDTGVGIPAKQRERIFERFTQESAGRERGGFGLGLAFCRSAIAAHGGRIWAEQGDGGVGTKMIFTLPIENKA